MVRLARAEVFDSADIAIAHVYNRAVRRCFSMGDDAVSGKNFDHRKVWIEVYLQQFAAAFAIDLLNYAILSNWLPNQISWWMRLLCQRVAQRANREVEENGRFFQDRYRETRLVDEAQLLLAGWGGFAGVGLSRPEQFASCRASQRGEPFCRAFFLISNHALMSGKPTWGEGHQVFRDKH